MRAQNERAVCRRRKQLRHGYVKPRFGRDTGGKPGCVQRGLLIVALVSLAAAAPASASITVAKNAQRPALRVDARGNAEISWTQRGVRKTLLVPARGRVLPGGRIRTRDVSRPTTAVAIPFKRVLKRTPDGRYWALQAWRVQAGGAVELRFSRWRGAPTSIVASADGLRIAGTATFNGRPVPTYSRTPAGTRLRSYAYIDCFACPAAPTSWQRLLGVAIAADGSFVVGLRPTWRGAMYRVSVPGPNVGANYAPDASVTVAPVEPPPP